MIGVVESLGIHDVSRVKTIRLLVVNKNPQNNAANQRPSIPKVEGIWIVFESLIVPSVVTHLDFKTSQMQPMLQTQRSKSVN